MRVLRVFPRRTRATPDDELVVVGRGPDWFDEADEVHVSVTFSWDMPAAEKLVKAWGAVARVKMGGPATGMAGGEFTPGLYLKHGYVITSRGCPNRCWFCEVPKREGGIRELPIQQGWNVLDDNLLACSDEHVKKVFGMLKRQRQRAEFTGGLEAARLKYWHVEELAELNPKQLFFAYDTSDDLEPLRAAGRKLLDAGFSRASHTLRCFVLCGFPKDTIARAERRMLETLGAGFTPMAMLYRDKTGARETDWRKFQRQWARPAMIHSRAEEKAGRRRGF